MSTPTATPAADRLSAAAREPAAPRRLGRSILALAAAFVANAALSLATDELFHALGVYPPWGEPMYDPKLNALALGYRLVYGVLGGAIVARLAPRAPMRHAVIGGVIGTVVSALGIVAATQRDFGPLWYPIALAASALPTTWLGAAWYLRRHAA